MLFCSRKCLIQFGRPQEFFVLNRGRNGSTSCATVSVLVDNWLTKPQKDQRSVWLAGVVKFDIASMINVSMWYPSGDSWNPANVTLGWQNTHLSLFKEICCSWHRCRTCLTCARWLSTSLSYMTVLSTIHLNPINLSKASAMRWL